MTQYSCLSVAFGKVNWKQRLCAQSPELLGGRSVHYKILYFYISEQYLDIKTLVTFLRKQARKWLLEQIHCEHVKPVIYTEYV